MREKIVNRKSKNIFERILLESLGFNMDGINHNNNSRDLANLYKESHSEKKDEKKVINISQNLLKQCSLYPTNGIRAFFFRLVDCVATSNILSSFYQFKWTFYSKNFRCFFCRSELNFVLVMSETMVKKIVL